MGANIHEIEKLLGNRRKSKGLTQEKIGYIIGVQKSTISKVEIGIYLNIKTIDRLSRVLQVEPMVTLKPNVTINKELIDYVMAAIMEFARHHGLSIREASNYLNRFKGIDYLTEFYDVEHTLSFNDCINDVSQFRNIFQARGLFYRTLYRKPGLHIRPFDFRVETWSLDTLRNSLR